MDIIDRLQKIIEYQGMTVSAFARAIGVPDQSIRGIVVQRRNKPGFDLIVKIVHAFDWLNADWLITGRGDMVKKENPSKEVSTNESVLMSYIMEKDNKIEKLIEEKTALKLKIESYMKENG